MRQIWIPRAGPPEVLEIREARDPLPGAGQLRIRVAAAGVNFADVQGRMGMYPDLPPMPVVPGYEVAGQVDAVGEGVDASWIAKEVFALTRFGGYSDVVCVPEHQVFGRPPAMALDEAAGDIQAQTGSSSYRLCREKGVEDLSTNLHRDSRTVIDHPDEDVAAFPLGRHNNTSAMPDGIERVVDQFRPDVIQFPAEAVDRRQFPFELEAQVNRFFLGLRHEHRQRV